MEETYRHLKAALGDLPPFTQLTPSLLIDILSEAERLHQKETDEIDAYNSYGDI